MIQLAARLQLGQSHRFPKKQDYGAERSMAEQFINRLIASGKNLLVLCHEAEIWDDSPEATAPKGYEPLLRGQSKAIVTAKFNEIYRLERKVVGPERFVVLRTKPTGETKIGSRLGIADETPWNWPAISAELTRIAKVRAETVIGGPK